MRKILFILLLFSTLLFSSCKDCSLFTPNLAREFEGKYHGLDVEMRMSPNPSGGTFDEVITYSASVEIIKISKKKIDIIISLCHPNDGEITFSLAGNVNRKNPDEFAIEPEAFLAGIVVGGTNIETIEGIGIFSPTRKSITITFKETRVSTSNLSLIYKSEHSISTNEVGTGSPGC